MLRVRLLAAVMRGGVHVPAGDVLDVSDAEAESLVDRGLAELADDAPSPQAEPLPTDPGPAPAPVVVAPAAPPQLARKRR